MKSPLQTAFEKMTDEELQAVFGFVTDRSKGATARLFVIAGQLEFEQRQRGILPKPKGINLITHPEEGLAEVVKDIRTNQAGHVHIVKGSKNAIANLDSEAFEATARAHYGVNYFFGDQAMKAAQDLDERFFVSALEAVRVLKMRSRGLKPKGGESKMLLHIQTSLTFFHEGDEKGQLPQRKVTKQKLREVLETRLGSRSFSSKSESWPDFFKRPEIAPFVEDANGGGRPKKSGKGRAVEAFDHHPGGKQQGGK